jgi:hypothetical protein
MPLLDHFHPPLFPRRHWESFHSRWASALADLLNEDLLPKEFFAEPQGHGGTRVELDVGTFEDSSAAAAPRPDDTGTATLTAPVWTPPAPPLTLPAVFPETFEVRVFGNLPGGVELVAAIELVSPGNKDRAEERRTFAIKCSSYLSQGISLIVMDIVTERQANLHNEMMRLVQAPEAFLLPADAGLYAVAYRPVIREERREIDLWPAAFTLGATLPLLPLGLTRGLCLPVDFEATYMEACRRLRLL